jgi:lipoate-protein ligase A
MSLLDLTLETVEENLALDEALLIDTQAHGGGGVIRFWEAAHLAVVLGASRRLAEDVRLSACQAEEVPILRRSSGGGTVLVGPGALNVSLVLPETAAPGLSAVAVAQQFVLQKIAVALRSAERPVEVQGLGDLTIGDRKFGGSAQRRVRDWFMVHCSILYDFPLELVNRYLAVPARQPEYRAGRSHDDFLMNLVVPRKILRDLVLAAWTPALVLCAATDVPHERLNNLLAERFANRSWIERL